MQIVSLLFTVFLLFLISPTSCRPNHNDDAEPDDNKPKPEHYETCTANQDGAIPGWAANPEWSTSMTACLQQMNNSDWNGANCIPKTSDGTLLGPSFGFWKGEHKYHEGGQDCFDQCVKCLMKGIEWHQAQTLQCHYYVKHGLFSRKKHCYVGFDYEIWAPEATATTTATATVTSTGVRLVPP